MKDIDGKDNRFLISLDSIIIVNKNPQLNDKNVFDQKQNKTIDNEIVTPNKLDAEAEDILGSLENDVMKILKKTKYFDKVLEE
jgi:hypothetical protein